MKALLPFLQLFKNYKLRITLGVLLALLTLFASIFLLSLSGWFLAGTALAGFAGLYTFNYMLPSAGVRGSAITRTASRYGERLVSHDTTFRILTKLRTLCFSKILPLSANQLAQYRKAELLNRLVADIDTLDQLYLRIISPFISAAIIIIIVTFSLSFFNVSLACLIAVLMLSTLLILPTIFYFLGKESGHQLTELKGLYREETTHLLQGNAELTIFGARPCFRDNLDKIEQAWQNQQDKQTALTGLSTALMLLTSGLVAITILWLAIGNVNNASNAIIALFFFATLASFEALAAVPTAFLYLGQVIASANRVNQLCEQTPDIPFPKKTVTFTPKNSCSVQISQLSFSYPNQLEKTLNNISLTVNPQEHIALLGKTGCGKSTLLHLINRFWLPAHGEITLNSLPLSVIDEKTLREIIAFVPQRTTIFNETLRYNLQIANNNATDEELITALNQVKLHYLLDESSLNQWLGEGGRQLSGGELRRIGIARALLHHSPLIMMDEPTEGLDEITEKDILSLIASSCREKTLIIVTHRLTGLEYFDHIYVMDNGKIVESGNHQQLMACNGYYSELVAAL